MGFGFGLLMGLMMLLLHRPCSEKWKVERFWLASFYGIVMGREAVKRGVTLSVDGKGGGHLFLFYLNTHERERCLIRAYTCEEVQFFHPSLSYSYSFEDCF